MLNSNLIHSALAAAATLALFQVPASAATARLDWKDLDLTTEAGRATLDSRIELVAKKACTPEPTTGSRISTQPNAQCLADAKAQIMSKLAAKLPQGTYVAVAESGSKQAH